MRNRIRNTMVGGAVAIAVLIGAPPASAGSLSWTDDADDAHVSVEPSEASLDILKVTLTSDGTNFVWKADMKELGSSPSASLGYHFQLDFAVGDALFNIRLTDDPNNQNVRLRADNAGTVTQVTCDKCKGEISAEAKSVTATVPIEELAKISKTAFPSAAPFGPGTTLENLLFNSYRSFAAAYLRADDAPAPDGGPFTI